MTARRQVESVSTFDSMAALVKHMKHPPRLPFLVLEAFCPACRVRLRAQQRSTASVICPGCAATLTAACLGRARVEVLWRVSEGSQLAKVFSIAGHRGAEQGRITKARRRRKR